MIQHDAAWLHRRVHFLRWRSPLTISPYTLLGLQVEITQAIGADRGTRAGLAFKAI